jgi:nitrous oxidase accessory protein
MRPTLPSAARRTRVVLLALAGVAAWTAAAHGARIDVPARAGAVHRAALEAREGDTLLLARGVHGGPLVLTRRVTLRGEPGAVLDGGGRGTVLRVEASGCRVEDLTIRSSGRRVLTTDAGVRVAGAGQVVLRGLTLRGVLYGIVAERASGIAIDSCAITGTAAAGAEVGEGNGIHLWYCEAPVVRGCSVERFADAAYLSFTTGASFEDSRFEWNARYGFHTMYCQSNRLTRNRFAHNQAGCAIMFSNHLAVERNDFVHNRGPRTYGLLLRDCSDGLFRENRLVDNTIAIFMDGSNRNRFAGNLVQDNGWGLLLYASSEGNTFAENSFINNDYPVALDMRRTGNRFDDGASGNYWSENAAYDLDGDRLSDVPYSPVSAFAFLSKQVPDLSVLAHSPAVAALSVAERVIPALRPSEAVDRRPLVRPRGDRPALREGTVRPDWLRGAGFLALGALGALGFARGRRVR